MGREIYPSAGQDTFRSGAGRTHPLRYLAFQNRQNLFQGPGVKNKTYSIFGAGAAGLYTAWRLLDGKTSIARDKPKLLAKGDTLELYDWGKYDFSKAEPGTRSPGARVWRWY